MPRRHSLACHHEPHARVCVHVQVTHLINKRQFETPQLRVNIKELRRVTELYAKGSDSSRLHSLLSVLFRDRLRRILGIVTLLSSRPFHNESWMHQKAALSLVTIRDKRLFGTRYEIHDCLEHQNFESQAHHVFTLCSRSCSAAFACDAFRHTSASIVHRCASTMPAFADS